MVWPLSREPGSLSSQAHKFYTRAPAEAATDALDETDPLAQDDVVHQPG